MRKNLFILFTLLSTLLLFADLEFTPGYNYNLVGPAYNGSTVEFVSDTLHVTNTGSTEEFTIHMETSEIPAGWQIMWCHDYEDALCHFPIFPWSFDFVSGTEILIDISVIYNSSPGSADITLFWSAAGIDNIRQDFTFRTEDFVDVYDNEIIPAAVLGHNYPNPFNPETTITYNLSSGTTAELSIYNLKGELVRSFGKSRQEAGEHYIIWDGKDNQNHDLSSGMYLYKLNVAQDSYTRKMILIK
ncbi:MAG: T9SS type A sorting domain-containing protein [Candidatus Cloacimonetes bacterium]|nr:T9SS type A sorting domain-containing protein [Candidatus Cloacimonadota bacterium]